MARRRGYANVSRLRRKLRRFDPEMTAPLREVIEDGIADIERDAKARAPKRTGQAAAAIRSKISRDGFTGKVGVLGKRAMKKAWYLIFAEFGTVQRTRKSGSSTGSAPKQAWLAPAFKENMPGIKKAFEKNVNQVLKKVARGG